MKAFNGSGSNAIFKQLSGLTGIGYLDMARFCLSNPYISTIDAGVRSVGEYVHNAGASGMPPLTPAERADMRERARRVSPYLNKICRECMHCLEKFECPEGVNFPRMLGVHGRYQVSKSLGFDLAQYRDEYYAAMGAGAVNTGKNAIADAVASGAAASCIKCGKCAPWCEYHLNIPEMLELAAVDFK
jgi:predicted aldo/keto reductase-like oxidoreductase